LTALALAALVVLLISLGRLKRERPHLDELRAIAHRQFLECTVHSSDPRFAFVGSAATVERREETGGVRGLFELTADLAVTIYATNPYGERFLFKWFSKSSSEPPRILRRLHRLRMEP